VVCSEGMPLQGKVAFAAVDDGCMVQQGSHVVTSPALGLGPEL